VLLFVALVSTLYIHRRLHKHLDLMFIGSEAHCEGRCRDKLAAIKTIKYRDVDYVTAKKEVMGYFQERGRSLPLRDRGRS
jgi:hypothetical protein